MAIARDLGNRTELANLLVGFAVVAKASRNWKDAEANLVEAISLKSETGYNPNEVRNELAELYIGIGRLQDAGKVLQGMAESAEQSGAHLDLGDMLVLQATLARLEGRLDQAESLDRRAVEELRLASDPIFVRSALADLSSIHTARGNLDQAERDLSEGGQPQFPEEQGAVRLARAELLLARARYSEAASEAKQAAAAYDHAHLDDRAAAAFVTAADALDGSGKTSEATAACSEAEKRAALTPNQLPKAQAAICSWRMAADKSIAAPANLRAEVARLQNPEVSLTLDYAEAVRAKRSGHPSGQIVEAAAAKMGYVTLSRRAAALAK